jgi:hypothetical protein
MQKRFAAALIAFAIAGRAARSASAAPVPPTPPPAGDVKQWVDQKVADCEPRPEERTFDQTGWAPDIRTALKLAKEHNRPVFLFTHDGHMAVGRC